MVARVVQRGDCTCERERSGKQKKWSRLVGDGMRRVVRDHHELLCSALVIASNELDLHKLFARCFTFLCCVPGLVCVLISEACVWERVHGM